MDDLISREAVKIAIVEKGQASRRYKLGETWELNREEAWEAIDSVPSAQSEIIRCKDCKHWNELLNICDRTKRLALGANGFCSRAERKDNG